MNLPNKITIFRVFLIPLIIIVSLVGRWDVVWLGALTIRNAIILALFLIGAFSDFLDGYLARRRNLITTFGQFIDPLADKLLVVTLLIILMQLTPLLPDWIVIIIIAREFVVNGLRMLAALHQKVIAAGWLGKIKTNCQFLMIILLLIDLNPVNFYLRSFWIAIVGLTLIMTIVSGSEYLVKNIDIFKNI